jgi:putative inorganic carbon (hco3(-)) transporter
MNKVERVLERVVEIAIYGLVFIIPFSKAGIEIFGITAIVGWILARLINSVRNEKRLTFLSWAYDCFGLRPRNDVRLALSAFLFVNLLSCITSIAPAHSINAFFTKTLEYALFFIVIASVFSDAKGIKRLLLVVLVSTALCYINGLAQYFMGFDLVRRDALAGYRISGSLINPNDFGSYVIMFIPVLLSLVIWKKLILRYRVIIISVFLMSLFCLVLSYSRGAWLGFLAGILFFGFLKSKKFFLCFVVILIAGLFFMPQRAKDRMKQIDSMEKVTINYRTIVWKEALSVIEDWPILGTGLNTYTLVGPHYKIHPKGGIYPHNCYLQMAAETGIVGLTAFLWFLWAIFSRGVRLLRRLRRLAMTESTGRLGMTESTGRLAMTDGKEYLLILGLMAGILGFLVNAFFDTTLYALRLVSLFWVMMGILVALCNIAERKEGVKT